MLLNGHNLEIVKFAGSDECKGYRMDTVQVSSKGTTVCDGFVLIRVSGLSKDNAIKPFLLDAATTAKFTDDAFESDTLALFNRVEGEIIEADNVAPASPIKAALKLRASLLLRVALSALMFAEGKDASLEVEICGERQPVKLTTKNQQTGQRWLALVMPTTDENINAVLKLNQHEGSHEEFRADAEVVDEFQAAIRAAELLGL